MSLGLCHPEEKVMFHILLVVAIYSFSLIYHILLLLLRGSKLKKHRHVMRELVFSLLLPTDPYKRINLLLSCLIHLATI